MSALYTPPCTGARRVANLVADGTRRRTQPGLASSTSIPRWRQKRFSCARGRTWSRDRCSCAASPGCHGFMSGCTASSRVRSGPTAERLAPHRAVVEIAHRAVGAVAGIGVEHQLALHAQLGDHARGEGPPRARAPGPPTRTPAPRDARRRGGSGRRGWRAGGGRGSRPCPRGGRSTSSRRVEQRRVLLVEEAAGGVADQAEARPHEVAARRRAATTGSSHASPVSRTRSEPDHDADAGPEVGEHVLAVGDERERAVPAPGAHQEQRRARG